MAEWGFPKGSGDALTADEVNVFMPIGSIIAWAKTYTNTPALPEGWVECDGSVLSDADSVYNGQTLLDLNGGEFLRGAATSGGTGGGASVTLTSTELPAHTHTGPNHTHTGPSHTHNLSSHTHTGPSHSHTVNSHTHSGPSHSHTVCYHSHSTSRVVNYATVTDGAGFGSYCLILDCGLCSTNTGSANPGTSSESGTTGSCAPGTNNGGTGATGAPSNNTSGSEGTGATGSGGTGASGSAGSGSAFSILPIYYNVVYIMRVK